jgi:hypothetical protein
MKSHENKKTGPLGFNIHYMWDLFPARHIETGMSSLFNFFDFLYITFRGKKGAEIVNKPNGDVVYGFYFSRAVRKDIFALFRRRNSIG